MKSWKTSAARCALVLAISSIGFTSHADALALYDIGTAPTAIEGDEVLCTYDSLAVVEGADSSSFVTRPDGRADCVCAAALISCAYSPVAQAVNRCPIDQVVAGVIDTFGIGELESCPAPPPPLMVVPQITEQFNWGVLPGTGRQQFEQCRDRCKTFAGYQETVWQKGVCASLAPETTVLKGSIICVNKENKPTPPGALNLFTTSATTTDTILMSTESISMF